MQLSERFADAMTHAYSLHHAQERKGSGVPYLAHLLGVASLVLDAGGDEDEAIAGLLHDAVEDQGGMDTLTVIRQRFGDRVAEIVLGCSDAVSKPKPPWKERKLAYLEHLQEAPASVRLVSCADKLHNARSILADHLRLGAALWDRFSASRDQQIWYFRSLLEIFQQGGPWILAGQLATTLAAIEQRVADENKTADTGSKG